VRASRTARSLPRQFDLFVENPQRLCRVNWLGFNVLTFAVEPSCLSLRPLGPCRCDLGRPTMQNPVVLLRSARRNASGFYRVSRARHAQRLLKGSLPFICQLRRGHHHPRSSACSLAIPTTIRQQPHAHGRLQVACAYDARQSAISSDVTRMVFDKFLATTASPRRSL
jgi:hypothetical protein